MKTKSNPTPLSGQPPTLRQLIEGAQSPVRHESGGLTNEALGCYRVVSGRFTPEVALAVLEALEGALDYGDFNANEEMPGRLRTALALLNGQAQPSPAP